MRIVDHDFTIGKLPVSFSNPLAFERKAEKHCSTVEKGVEHCTLGKGGSQ